MYKTSKNCQEIFVLSGGFHLLKQWLKLADEQENISEIILLIELCKLLPFDVVCVKTSEIGKVIKKISKKYVQQSASKESSNGRSDSANRPEILQKVIRNIMEVWSTLHQKNVLIVLPTDSTNRNIPSLVVDINNRLINEKGKVIQEDTSVSTEVDNSRSRAIVKQSVVQNEDQTKLKVVEPEASLQNVHNEAAIVADSTQESDDSSNNEVKITTPIARKPGLIIVQGPVASVNIKEELASTPTNGLSALFPSIPILPAPTAFPSRTSFKAPTAIGERKSSSMADGARRLLQLRAQASASNSSSSETKDGADTSAESHKVYLNCYRR